MVVEFQFVKPGKGNAFTRTKIRNMITGSVLDRTFKTGEKIKRADTEEREMQFLYNDGSWHFMDSQSYEQVSLEAQLVGNSGDYLSENMEIQISFYQGRPIGLTLPKFVNLGVVETTPGERGNTVTGATKPARLSTGYKVNVPLFINEGAMGVEVTPRTFIEGVKQMAPDTTHEDINFVLHIDKMTSIGEF